jgi:hypothetical protein
MKRMPGMLIFIGKGSWPWRKHGVQAMKKISDYIFSPSWQLGRLKIAPNQKYAVLVDLGDLNKGDLVTFVGYDDVDNHCGIFVFTDSAGQVLEVSGDCAGPNHQCLLDLERALSAPQSLNPGAADSRTP